MYGLPSTGKIMKYLHTCAGFQTKSTWVKAIKGGKYVTRPHLSIETVKKHFTESDETAQGHMKAIKQDVRSTKTNVDPTTVFCYAVDNYFL